MSQTNRNRNRRRCTLAEDRRAQRALSRARSLTPLDERWESRYELRDTPGKGRGIFATRQYTPGATVMTITGQVLSARDYSSLYCMELGARCVLEPHIPGALINHSCDPNCELTDHGAHDALSLVAICNIQPGQELSYDYGWPAEIEPVHCRCGSVKCRGWIVAAAQLRALIARLRRSNRNTHDR